MPFALPPSIVRGLPTDCPTTQLGFSPSVVDRIKNRLMTAVGAFPTWAVRPLAGRRVVRDGQRLDPHFQLGVRVVDLVGHPTLSVEGLPNSRHHTVADAYGVAGSPVSLPVVEDISVPVQDAAGQDAGMIGARLYRPTADPRPLPLLAYFHGGGWVHGNLDSHDATCRYLAARGDLAVLAVDYRLAPEHRFPTGVYDALSAFRFACTHAAELGVDPGRIAVGGDSAGGNLAAVVSLLSRDTGGPLPAMQLLIVPVTQFGAQTASRALFAEGFYLTGADMDFFEEVYLPVGQDPDDFRVSPLQATDLSGLPPAFVAVAGFDPLRDEGEAFAARLREAGVHTSVRRFGDVVHPFVNAPGASARARAALDEIVGALRQGLGY